MAATKRTDIHRPSAPEFDPESYDCHGVFDLADEWGHSRVLKAQTVAALLAQGYSFHGAPHGSGQCSHCGAHLRYAALMTHEPTRTMLYVGETCLTDRFEALTKSEFDRLRKTASLNRERTAKRDAVASLVAGYPELAELTDPQSEIVAASDFLRAIADKLNRYGDLTDRQIDSAVSVITKFRAARARRTQREDAARAASTPVPDTEERVTVTGVIHKVEVKDNEYTGGVRLVMTVLDDRGFKVLGTVPRSLTPMIHGELASELTGRRVTFTALVKRGDREPTFGFFNRPTKASFL